MGPSLIRTPVAQLPTSAPGAACVAASAHCKGPASTVVTLPNIWRRQDEPKAQNIAMDNLGLFTGSQPAEPELPIE
ncbi:uncharacterized protein B0H64DRAFT_437391 [Chaetomium fimeti]|uniref:Uncharacterized protein n=1 Tax=Chaetomium fimeti TaxID=1854472 RepID=A0AAE0HP82_9PEZI|nr:hypothetical protein B0H64DRAFT_437391 [Chaetomium fimeti]